MDIPVIVELNSSSLLDGVVLGDTKAVLSACSESSILIFLQYYYPKVKIFIDVVCHYPPFVLPPDRVVRNKIDLAPRTKYYVTR